MMMVNITSNFPFTSFISTSFYICYLLVSLLSKSTHAVCITTYQERSSNRTLLPYLEKYGLEVTEIQTEQILHGCNLVGQVWKDTAGDDDEDGKDGEDVPCFHSIHLLEIRLDQ